MFPVLLTVDVTYSRELLAQGAAADCDANFACSIECDVPGGAVGLSYQMDVMESEGLTGVFFVDPMPSLVWGPDAVMRVVQPILERGHEVQLLLHAEWLEHARNNPIGDRTGNNLSDFCYDDQATLIEYAAGQLVSAGAAWPIAFRAGNHGANDDTLRALSRLGIFTDMSFAPGHTGASCAISLPPDEFFPRFHEGVLEMPLGLIASRSGTARLAQLADLSFHEFKSAITYAQAADWEAFAIAWDCSVMLDSDSFAVNRKVKRHFEKLCEWLGSEHEIAAVGIGNSELNARLARPMSAHSVMVPAHAPVRDVLRKGEQAIASLMHR